MVTSWGVLLPSGVLIAHFLRHRDPLWFKLHRAIQSVGICLAIAGFTIAVTQFNVFGPGNSAGRQAHGYMGCVVMVLGVLQPINAYFRPHANVPKSAIRVKWEWLHRGSGYFAILLAVPTIWLGTSIAGLVGTSFQVSYSILLFLLASFAFVLYRNKRLQKALQK